MGNSCKICGQCCKLFLINLSQKEYKSGEYQTMFQDCGLIDNFHQAKNCGANLLAKKTDNSCVYLIDNRCSIHSTRPRVCQHFFCTSKNKKFQAMIKIIKENKKIV